MGDHGGAKRFLAFLEKELMPYVQEHYSADHTKSILFGHSLGGYFVPWTLCIKPSAFRYYIASSPSIWWNNHELFRYVAAFLKQNTGGAIPSLFMSVGEKETFMVDDALKLKNQLE
ncbi:alpha/beta hydrolase [Domibacillus robiginosus]|uniref:alpha/beta hydrolase n=1 Tax=Domibacillus robiginosus TaxID=1071054 RepID=UPI00067CEFE6|nr:alpha/beta hydrolase-fold protein [Domibacillus robiginosus]